MIGDSDGPPDGEYIDVSVQLPVVSELLSLSRYYSLICVCLSLAKDFPISQSMNSHASNGTELDGSPQ